MEPAQEHRYEAEKIVSEINRFVLDIEQQLRLAEIHALLALAYELRQPFEVARND